jgi:hypothetical protein
MLVSLPVKRKDNVCIPGRLERTQQNLVQRCDGTSDRL